MDSNVRYMRYVSGFLAFLVCLYLWAFFLWLTARAFDFTSVGFFGISCRAFHMLVQQIVLLPSCVFHSQLVSIIIALRVTFLELWVGSRVRFTVKTILSPSIIQ